MATERRVLRESIANFYQINHDKGKFFTYPNFKSALPKTTIYRIMNEFDDRGTVSRKTGSGRPEALTKENKSKLRKLINNKTGVSQRKLGKKFNLAQTTISTHIKKLGIEVKKRKRAPKQTPEQKARQDERLQSLIQTSFSEESTEDIVMDDESYFTLDGTGLPGNDIFYTDNVSKTPNEVRFRRQAKFPAKIMVWAVISRRGIKLMVFGKKFTSMDNVIYRKKCLTKVLKFVEEHYDSKDDVIFWPDLATCHYHKDNLAWLEQNGLKYVPKNENPPNAPQICPLENFGPS